MVFQDPTGSLNPRKTIYEIVAEGLRIHGIHEGPNGKTEEELVARALSRAGMRPPERFYLLYPHELSGGQRQRVVIAGALALDPKVIVADEPVSNLDASVRGEILQLLMQLRETLKISLLIVTHDLGLAWTVADRVAVMYLGRIVEIGPAEEVLQRPKHPYTKALLDVVPEAGGIERPILTGEPPDPTNIPPGCRFHPRCPVVASGRAAQLGIEDRCRGEDIAPLLAEHAHLAACHLVPLGEQPYAAAPKARPSSSRPARHGESADDGSPLPSLFKTPRIASISVSETPASGLRGPDRALARRVRRFDSAMSARPSSSFTFSVSPRARCSASSRDICASRASSRAVRSEARSCATSRPRSTTRSTTARPKSE